MLRMFYHGILPVALTSPTCHGYSLTSVSAPPTILMALLGIPQVQVELVWVVEAAVLPPEPVVVTGAAVVVVGGGTVLDQLVCSA